MFTSSISSAESQKGAVDIHRCSVESKKGAIVGKNKRGVNADCTFLVLNVLSLVFSIILLPFKVHINRFNSPFISLYIFLLHLCPVYVIHDVFDQYHWFTCFLLTMSLVRDSHRQVHFQFQSRCPSFPLLEDRDRRTTLTPLSGLEGHLADGFCHEKFPCRSDLFHRSIPHSM